MEKKLVYTGKTKDVFALTKWVLMPAALIFSKK